MSALNCAAREDFREENHLANSVREVDSPVSFRNFSCSSSVSRTGDIRWISFRSNRVFGSMCSTVCALLDPSISDCTRFLIFFFLSLIVTQPWSHFTRRVEDFGSFPFSI